MTAKSSRSSPIRDFRRISEAVARAIFPCRAAIVVVAGLVVAFDLDQGQEALRVVCEDSPAVASYALAGATGLLAHNCWYFNRVVLRFRFPGERPLCANSWEDWIHRSLATQFPRVLGGFAIAMVAWVVYHSRGTAQDPSGHNILSLGLVGMFGLFTFLASRRRRFHTWLQKRFSKAPPALTALWREVDIPIGSTCSLAELPAWTWVWLGAHALLLIVAVTAFTTQPVLIGQSLEAPAILVVTASGLVCIGTVITFAAQLTRWPIFLLLAVWSFACSTCNDNHVVHAIVGDVARPNLADDFDRWYASVPGTSGPATAAPQDGTAKGTQQPPWFFVVTEGGGIRAAYWTAAVLSAAEDAAPGFGQHLFGISSVSGGSLGAGVYVGLLSEDRAPGTMRAAASRILGVDSLAPVIAKGLYPDLLQRLLPQPVEAFDRGKALEDSWTRAFACETHDEVFSQNFNELWRKHSDLPRLFLNSTRVETGQRAIVSYPTVGGIAIDSGDVQSEVGAVTFAAAVHLSARFTYVSPAGRMIRPNGTDWGHLVDGGYFDNSGAATALEVLDALRDHATEKPTVIVIRYQEHPTSSRPLRFANELLPPFETLLNARAARGTLALASLEKAGYPTLVFELTENGVSFPLGWLLSKRTREAIDEQVFTGENRKVIDNIRGVLAMATGPRFRASSTP